MRDRVKIAMTEIADCPWQISYWRESDIEKLRTKERR